MVRRSRLSVGDLARESVEGVLQRPARSLLTMLGTVLGIASLVAIVGIAVSAGNQIDKRFTLLAATEVTVQDVSAAEDGQAMGLPLDARLRIGQINGVVSGGLIWPLPLRDARVTAAAGVPASASGMALYAVDPGALAALHPSVVIGRAYDEFHEMRGERVALLGSVVAQRLGISQLETHPAVFINDMPYTVVGIVNNLQRRPELLFGVMIPARTAFDMYGAPSSPAGMLVETRLGAARVVADQLALAIRPDAPESVHVVAPLDPQTLREGVSADVDSLLVLLALVSLVVGAVGIANTTFVSVLERVSEIGVRRSLGARPAHIAAQFLTESMLLGTLGGLMGSSVGVLVVLGVATAKNWTAVLPPWLVIVAPVVGTVVGLAAGTYPALRAARIDPVDALRRF
jgi:putative ABC transport system permease protein